MIPNNLIEEIRNKADIVKVISEYVPLKKRGKNYLGLCPFHQEKDASFTVSPDKQIFHCFGCNEGGNVFNFLMKIENINFIESVEELGAKLGFNLPKTKKSGPSKTDKDKLYHITSLAADFFQQQLLQPSGQAARNYLKQRGISEETSKAFGLGYAPDSWDSLFKHLVSRGADPVLITKTGLTIPREGKSGYYDRFRNRLIFPIYDQRGRALAFGGRSLGVQEPKYLNSPETIIYHKGQVLFGLNLSKNEIKSSKTAILVEGNFDLVTPYQAGIKNIVAILGTALTAQQAKLLSRYCENVILAFDADNAGSLAAERSIEVLKTQGLAAKVAYLSEAKDPDELIKQKGPQALKQALDQALPELEFKIRNITAKNDLTSIEGKAKAISQIAALLAQEKDTFVQKGYLEFAALQLHCDIESLSGEVKRLSHYKAKSKTRSLRTKTEKPSSKSDRAEKSILALASQNYDLWQKFKSELTLEAFSSQETRSIAQILLDHDFKPDDNIAHAILDKLAEEKKSKFFSSLLINDLAEQGDQTTVFADCLKTLKERQHEQKLRQIKAELSAAEKSRDSEKIGQLLIKLNAELGAK